MLYPAASKRSGPCAGSNVLERVTIATASMSDPTWISVLPPVLAIVLAIVTRQVYLSLGAGIWLGATILAGGDPSASWQCWAAPEMPASSCSPW